MGLPRAGGIAEVSRPLREPSIPYQATQSKLTISQEELGSLLQTVLLP